MLRHRGCPIALLATAGTLAFYTFLLLPTAVRYDFRRDLDRMAMLKSLPISPAATVIGQTITPILIATVFQAIVLAFAIVAPIAVAALLVQIWQNLFTIILPSSVLSICGVTLIS